MNRRRNDLTARLLRRNISVPQIAGYALASFVGLAIILTALQFYRDMTASKDSPDSFLGKDYMVLSKKVGALGILGDGNGFSAADIEDLRRQPWARNTGNFTAAQFDVTASVDLGGRGMSTALFFESIPDEFFDRLPSGWTFDPEHPEIPVILSRDYLALYNFGFASARSLPQISESMISRIPLRVSVSGNGRQQYMPARIAGFSSRINTIAVPQSFMDWANSRFGTGDATKPSRLIVEVSDPGNPAISRYVRDNSLEIAGDRADGGGKATYFLSLATAAITCVGAVIGLLSLFILSLSLHLLLQKNRVKIYDLMQLGYTPAQVARVYCVMVAAVNVIVWIVASAVTVAASAAWDSTMRELGMQPVTTAPVILYGAAGMAVVTVISMMSVCRRVRSAFRLT